VRRYATLSARTFPGPRDDLPCWVGTRTPLPLSIKKSTYTLSSLAEATSQPESPELVLVKRRQLNKGSSGHWALGTGHWTLDTGHWTLHTRQTHPCLVFFHSIFAPLGIRPSLFRTSTISLVSNYTLARLASNNNQPQNSHPPSTSPPPSRNPDRPDCLCNTSTRPARHKPIAPHICEINNEHPDNCGGNTVGSQIRASGFGRLRTLTRQRPPQHLTFRSWRKTSYHGYSSPC